MFRNLLVNILSFCLENISHNFYFPSHGVGFGSLFCLLSIFPAWWWNSHTRTLCAPLGRQHTHSVRSNTHCAHHNLLIWLITFVLRKSQLERRKFLLRVFPAGQDVDGVNKIFSISEKCFEIRIFCLSVTIAPAWELESLTYPTLSHIWDVASLRWKTRLIFHPNSHFLWKT